MCPDVQNSTADVGTSSRLRGLAWRADAVARVPRQLPGRVLSGAKSGAKMRRACAARQGRSSFANVAGKRSRLGP